MPSRTIILERVIISFSILTVLAFLLFIIAPLPKASDANCNSYSGMVSKVVPGDGPGDILIVLKGDKNYYHINRGIDRGVSLKQLENKLVNKIIQVMTIRHYSILNPNYTTRHIAKITVDGSVVYSEM